MAFILQGRHLLLKIMLVVVTLGWGAQAVAQDYPSRPIRIVVPWVVGGSTDVLTRLLGDTLSKQMNQTVIVENRPGATGTIGTTSVVRAKPDGYTILMGTNSTFGIAPYLYKDLPFDPAKDLAPIGFVGVNQLILCVHPSAPAETLKEFIEYTKSTPEPVSFSSAGVGASSHLAMELLIATAGIDMMNVPYKGGAPSLQGLLANETEAGFVDVSTVVPLIQSGQLRALGAGGMKRSQLLPDLPTIDEAGLAGFEAQTTFGLFAPAGTPDDVIQTLNSALNTALKDPELQKRALALGFELNISSPQDLAAHVASEAAKWSKLIKDRDIKFE